LPGDETLASLRLAERTEVLRATAERREHARAVHAPHIAATLGESKQLKELVEREAASDSRRKLPGAAQTSGGLLSGSRKPTA
jgi:hypothetical protein